MHMEMNQSVLKHKNMGQALNELQASSGAHVTKVTAAFLEPISKEETVNILLGQWLKSSEGRS